MKVSIPVAASSRHQADLSTDTLTTMNFFTMKPVYFKEVVPGEEVDIDINGRLRMMALNKPMFGSLMCRTKTFFVPYRVIYPHWQAFITDTREKNLKVTSIPSVSVYGLISKLVFGTTGYVTAEDVALNEGSVNYDFVIRDFKKMPDAEEYYHGCVFTQKGRRVHDILIGLGYNLPWGYTYLSDDNPNSIYNGIPTKFGSINLLSILAYAKIVADWFTLPAYQDKINTLGAAIDTISQPNQTEETILTNLDLILSLCVDLHYADDIFVSAWDNPVAPNQGTGSQIIQFKDITNNAVTDNNRSRVESSPSQDYQSQYNTTNGTPILRSDGNNSYPSNVSQYILNALQKLSSFMRRNQLVGYRPLDRYLARFGKKLTAEELLRSIVLDDDTDFKISISEVLSQSDTISGENGLSLGDYAGQGIGSCNGHVHFKAQEEFGVIITVCYIIPYIKYYQGLQPANRRLSMLDFFQPEFDGLGCEAIPSNTLVNDTINSSESGLDERIEQTIVPDSQWIFGYAPRGYSYKTNPYATVSGDFRLNSRNVGYEQWHLFRKISNESGSAYSWKHSQSFTEGSVDAANYNRIFQQTDGENDGFILGFHFGVKANLPMKALYDDTILNSDPDSEHSDRLTMSVGGTRMQ